MASTNRQLPDALHPAYDWTRAAGELKQLRVLDGDDLDRYCSESETNARAHDVADVTAGDLRDLRDWLRAEGS